MWFLHTLFDQYSGFKKKYQRGCFDSWQSCSTLAQDWQISRGREQLWVNNYMYFCKLLVPITQFSKCLGTRAVPPSPYRPHSVRSTGRIYYLHLLWCWVVFSGTEHLWQWQRAASTLLYRIKGRGAETLLQLLPSDGKGCGKCPWLSAINWMFLLWSRGEPRHVTLVQGGKSGATGGLCVRRASGTD